MIIKVADYAEKKIVISGNGMSQQPDPKEQICYDLHVGESVRYAGDDTRRPTPVPLRLKPNDCIRIETRESLNIPGTVFGLVCSRASLTAEGLVTANLKIDPKFQGKLVITVYNASKNVISIKPQLPFCSLFFATLETPVSPESPIRLPPETKIITGNRIIEWFHRSTGHIVTFILSVVASLIASYVFGWMRPPASTSDMKSAPLQLAPQPSNSK